MWQDPIIKEVRILRKQHASTFDNDADAIFEDMLKRQAESTREHVSFPPREPMLKRNNSLKMENSF